MGNNVSRLIAEFKDEREFIKVQLDKYIRMSAVQRQEYLSAINRISEQSNAFSHLAKKISTEIPKAIAERAAKETAMLGSVIERLHDLIESSQNSFTKLVGQNQRIILRGQLEAQSFRKAQMAIFKQLILSKKANQGLKLNIKILQSQIEAMQDDEKALVTVVGSLKKTLADASEKQRGIISEAIHQQIKIDAINSGTLDRLQTLLNGSDIYENIKNGTKADNIETLSEIADLLEKVQSSLKSDDMEITLKNNFDRNMEIMRERVNWKHNTNVTEWIELEQSLIIEEEEIRKERFKLLEVSDSKEVEEVAEDILEIMDQQYDNYDSIYNHIANSDQNIKDNLASNFVRQRADKMVDYVQTSMKVPIGTDGDMPFAERQIMDKEDEWALIGQDRWVIWNKESIDGRQIAQISGCIVPIFIIAIFIAIIMRCRKGKNMDRNNTNDETEAFKI